MHDVTFKCPTTGRSERTGRTFNLGRLLITASALDEVGYDEFFAGLQRHVAGDWGEVSAEDQEANERALELGDRLLSAYTTKDGVRFWIITEADRSSTIALLPEEY